MNNMKTIILAAGKSTRLLPLTKDTPQSLLLVGQKTIIGKQIDSLKEAGVKTGDITVVTGYLSQKLEEFCKTQKVKTLFNPFYNISSAAASLWVAKGELADGFIFCYADILFDSKIIKELSNKPDVICLATKRDGLRPEAERVFEESSMAKGISKTRLEKANSEFIGIAKFSKIGAQNIIRELENALKENIETSFIEVLDRLIKKGGKVTTLDVGDSRFIDIDFPEDLARAEEFFK